NGLAFSPRSGLLAFSAIETSRSNLHGIYLWDPATQRTVSELLLDESECSGLAFNEEGNVLATGQWDGTVRFWEIPPKENTSSVRQTALFQLPSDSRSFAASRDLRLLARDGLGGAVFVFDTQTTNVLWRSDEQADRLVFSPNSALIACGAPFMSGGLITLRE